MTRARRSSLLVQYRVPSDPSEYSAHLATRSSLWVQDSLHLPERKYLSPIFHLLGDDSEGVVASDVQQAQSRVKKELRRIGLMPVSDSTVPSLVSIVVGAPVSGSWWGHPTGRLIYQVAEALEADPDVLVLRIWNRKLTMVHRRLWPALVRVGEARTSWQMAGLSVVAQQLLARIDRDGTLRSDHLPANFGARSQGFRPALRALEQRLLVVTRSVHTSSGAHALEAESWAMWSASVRAPRFSGSVASAQLAIETAASRLSSRDQPERSFPWNLSRGRAGTSRRK